MRRHPCEPWVWLRLKAAPGASLALAFAVLLTVFLAALLPRALQESEDSALRGELASAPLDQRTVDLTARAGPGSPSGGALTPGALAATRKSFLNLVPGLRPRLEPSAGSPYGVATAKPVPDTDHGLARPTPDLAPEATVYAQEDLAAHARLADGAWPVADTTTAAVLHAAVTEETARVMRLRPGSLLHLPNPAGAERSVLVTGVLRPTDPAQPYWTTQDSLRKPTLVEIDSADGPAYRWHFALLLNPDSAAVLPGLSFGAQAYWCFPLRPAALHAADTGALLALFDSLQEGPDAARLAALSPLTDVGVTVPTALFTAYAAERSALTPVVLTAVTGAGVCALAVLALTAETVARRRRSEFELLRARGAGLAALAARLAAESATLAVPAAAVGAVLAARTAPNASYGPTVLVAAVIAAAVTLALPLRVLLTHRRPLPPGERDDLARARPSRRRTVAELTIVLLTLGAVATGAAESGPTGFDPYVALAPVLLAVAVAIVLLRLYPLPLRALSGAAGRLRGAVTQLGLARAMRSPAGTPLPVVAVMVVLTVASFGGCVVTQVSNGRQYAASAEVGADGRITATNDPLPDTLAGQVRRRVPGVTGVVPAWIQEQVSFPDGSPATFTLIAVDPSAYAALVAGTGVGRPFPTAALSGGTAAALPAVVSPGVARAFGSRIVTLHEDPGDTPVKVAAVESATPAAAGTDFVIVPIAGLARTDPQQVASGLFRTTDLFVTGSRLDGARLRAVADASGPVVVDLRARQLAAYGTPLESGIRWIYLAAVGAAALYGAVALLLSFAAGAAQRASALARLRTMGMTRRQFRGVVLLETVPPTLLALAGGVVVAGAAVPLAGRQLDLRTLAFGPAAATVPPVAANLSLHLDAVWLVLPAAGLLAVAVLTLLSQVWWAGRLNESTQLRMGDGG
ncbi:FtsX-like permease family protein [Streptantibioticus silvisoli]|uniref:ABC transporter permease n=1 Tax=Streptantibioticus silvisoli TaxID=2705255 RepID=A0ABT6W4T4_9ACTN|nr:ABC transporter permease [Streptantibioticus silvisoli]MDI5964967.1 ABC transporter permease [Streptantibioticus silvisoli]